MSTPSTTRSSSASNANRGGRSGTQRSAGGRPAARAASPPVAAFPQPLPARFARLIDGVNVTSISVSYTRYGMTVSVITADNEAVPLEQYEARAKALASARVFQKDLKMYRDRVAERQLQVPAAAEAVGVIDSAAKLQAWLAAWKAADPATFKILGMNARNFRAQQGANVSTSA